MTVSTFNGNIRASEIKSRAAQLYQVGSIGI